MNDVIYHYDRLIDENNDPVHDSKRLQDYMNQWDGKPFLDELQLSPEKTVLEIGVGTGRLALRTAPFCKTLLGIDISPKTICRAKENLSAAPNVSLICADFMEYNFSDQFDVIYSSLCFMHIKEKEPAFKKVAELLSPKGRFVLSIDKNQSECLDMGTRKIRIFPDELSTTCRHIKNVGLTIVKTIETNFSHIIVSTRG